ncbi:ATP-binding protein [soil metagenome]
MGATTTETDPARSAEESADPGGGARRTLVQQRGRLAHRWRQALHGVRTRVVASTIALLALSTVLSVVVMRQVLLARLDEEITEGMHQEINEFRRLAGGNDPQTGEPFGDDLRAILDTYFSRNVPSEGEAHLAFVHGRPYATAYSAQANRSLDLRLRWSRLAGDGSERGELQTPAGPVRYLAVPVRAGGEVRGTFVVANFPTHEREEIDEAVRVVVIVSASVLLLAGLVAWASAGRVVGPLRTLTDTARSITGSDRTRRIPEAGKDEVSELAATFNEMLDRLQTAFATQRDFVDDAGHELRTPITIIGGHLELLGDDPEERSETMGLVRDELARMNRMVDDLLMLAKAEQPDFLDPAVVDVHTLTRDLHGKAGALAPRGWRLERSGSGRIVGDPQRLTQAIMQLAQNAAQHTTDGDVIMLGSALADGHARFWVSDSGPGVAPEDAERIFARFGRATSSRRRSQGAGLGLSIVRAIAEAHHGRVELRSPPGEGATFTLVVPVDAPGDLPRAEEG